MPWIPVGTPMTGPPGTVDLATVTPLAAGSTPTAVVSGTPAARKLDLGIPIVPGGLNTAEKAVFDAQVVQVAALQKAVDDLSLELTLAKSDGELSARLRPTWKTIIRVGPSRTIKTIEAALTAAYATPGGFAGSLPGAYNQNTFAQGRRIVDNRILILIDPGTYTLTAIPDVGDGIDLVGLGASRDDVQIRSTSVRYSLRTWGSSYIKNLTLWHDEGAVGNNYTYHMSQVAAVAHFTNIFDNVHFKDTWSGSGAVIGCDIQNGQYLLFYKCRFSTTNTGPTPSNTSGAIINTHTSGSNSQGYRIMYVDCEVHERELSLGRPSFEVPNTAPVGTPANNRLWVKGCKTLNGATIPDKYVLNNVVQSTMPEPPLATGGMTAADAAKYTPTTAAGTVLARSEPGAQSTYVGGRVYFIPLGPLPYSTYVARVRIVGGNVTSHNGTSWNGSVNVGLAIEAPTEEMVYPGKPTFGMLTKAQVGNVIGNVEQTPNSDMAFTTGIRLWLMVTATSSQMMLASSTASSVGDCYYADGFTSGGLPNVIPALTKVPAGDAVPYAAIVTK